MVGACEDGFVSRFLGRRLLAILLCFSTCSARVLRMRFMSFAFRLAAGVACNAGSDVRVWETAAVWANRWLDQHVGTWQGAMVHDAFFGGGLVDVAIGVLRSTFACA